MSKFADGGNMQGRINIPNPSVMTLTIGDIIQDIFLDGEQIGNTTIKGVVLRPGDNFFPMSSYTDQIKVIPAIQKNYRDGILPIEARTREISYQGNRLQYFEEAMKTSPVKLKLDISAALKGIGLDISQLAPAP
jgi:hypothetical protein